MWSLQGEGTRGAAELKTDFLLETAESMEQGRAGGWSPSVAK